MAKNNKSLKKQSEINADFSFDNVGNADTMFSETNVEKIKTKAVNINFSVKKNIYTRFNKLLFETMIKFDDKYSNSYIFTLGVKFLKNELSNKKEFQVAPNFFLKIVTKVGRRKNTDRTPAKNEGKFIQGTVAQNILTNYINLMYSFYTKSDDFDMAENNLSTAYFFYDFVELLENNKSDFFKFIAEDN